MEDRELERLRGEIDRIDAAMTALLQERLAYVDEIAARKEALGLPVRDEGREAALLARVREQVGPMADEAEALFGALLALSRARQARRRADT